MSTFSDFTDSLASSVNQLASSVANIDLKRMTEKVTTTVNNLNIDNVFSNQPRGLSNFISEIRACKNKQDERIRVDAELGNIRNKFSTTAALTSYQKKKYVWKLCYIHMLGYNATELLLLFMLL